MSVAIASPSLDSGYDSFAWIYNRYMAGDFSRRALPAIERLFLQQLPPGARVLDLCCGTGQMARLLADRGYRVTGLDTSVQMLHFAHQNAPVCNFVISDARRFRLRSSFQGVLSTFNSLAHISGPEDLRAVFSNVCDALLPGGLFVFDVSMEEAYSSNWRGSFSMVAPDHVCVVRLAYEPDMRLGRNDVTLFLPVSGPGGDSRWRRSDFSILQKCHDESELRSALSVAGFFQVTSYDAQHDLGLDGEHGRRFFRAHKPAA